MKRKFLVGCQVFLGAWALMAQEGELESLKRALQEQQKVIQSLLQKVEALEEKQAGVTNEQARIKKWVTAPATNAPPETPVPVAKTWLPADPIRIGGSRNYLNLSFDGLVAVGGSTADDPGVLQPGGHDPKQRGFTVQNLELTLEGKVDPYFRGQGNVVLQINPDGGTIVEVEEAFAESMALPWNLQVKAGQYFTEFGRLNPTHPHAWAFVDQPLVNARFLGPDGLRNPGARVSWLLPTSFFSELMLGVQNSHGATATSFRSAGGHAHGGGGDALPFALRHPDNDRGLRNVNDLLLAPRWATSFDVTDAHTALFGASAAFGPNSSGSEGDSRTQIYGLDFTWKWKSSSHSGGFPFLQWQSEAMVRRYKAGAFDWDENGNGAVDDGELADVRTGLPAAFRAETLTDSGVYSQVRYGFRQGWVAGLRFDTVWGERGDYEAGPKSYNGGAVFSRDPMRDSRWRVSPNLTWFPTEFSKLRLQYNHDHRRDLGADHSIWLQLEFLLGAHAAHQF